MRKLISVLLCLIVVIGLIPLSAMPAQAAYPTPMETNSYDSDWHYWSQAGTKYRFFYYPSGGSKGGMHYAGCHVVAEAKLLVDAGIASSNVSMFNPDIYLEWANGTYYNADSSTYPVGINVNENNNRGPVAYAQKLGKTLYYCGNVSGSNFPSDRTAQITLIRSWLDKGYYVILGRKNYPGENNHEAYISKYDENGNIVSGDLKLYDSQSDMINSSHMFSGDQPYSSSTTIKTTSTKKYLIESYKAYEKHFNYAKLYSKTTSSLPSASGSVPAMPTGLAAERSGTSNIQITWNAVSGATQYEAQYIRSGISWTALAASPTTATSILAKGFSWNYDYVDFRVRAVNAEGASEWATIRLYKANPSAPAAPTVTVSGSSVTVSWIDVENENSYDVYLVQSPWAWEDIKYSKTGLTANTTSFTFSNVAAGDYKAFVISRPNYDSVQSGWTAVTVISPPQNAKVTTNKSLYSLGETVMITPSATGATYYAVSVWDGGDYGVGTQVYYNGHFTGSVSFTPEAAGTYGILCNAFNDGGRVSAKTTFDVVAVELNGWMSSEGTIHLSWTNPGWDGYWDIFRNSEASFGAAQKVARLNGSDSSWVDNTTQPSSRYFYVVQPVTLSGSSLAKSDAIEFITPDPAPPAIDSVAANKTAVTAGTPVTWTASASGGTGALQYCFYVFKDGKIVQRGSYGAANTYTYAPSTEGVYTVRVYVKDGSGTVVTLDNAAAVTVSAAPTTITGVTANRTTGTVGTSVTWTASASGGTGTLRYCFYVFKDGKVAERGSYGMAKTYTYTPAAGGVYTVRVYVKDGSGTVAQLDNAAAVTVSNAPLAVTGVTASKTAATVGDPVTWTAAATGGNAPLQYCFYVFKDGKVAQRGSYGTAKTYTYVPAAAGTYTVRVYVKDAYGTVVTLDNAGTVRVTAPAVPISITGVTPSRTSVTKGDSITWTASATGGTGTLQYCFYVFRNGQVVQRGSYGTAKTCTYRTDEAGTYTVRVYVKDGSGTVATLDNAGKVTASSSDPLTIFGLAPNKNSAGIGDSITWSAAATGGTGTLQYCFYVFKDGKVVQRGNYGTAQTCTYKPTAAGTYTVRVYVKDASGSVVTLDNAGPVTVS